MEHCITVFPIFDYRLIAYARRIIIRNNIGSRVDPIAQNLLHYYTSTVGFFEFTTIAVRRVLINIQRQLIESDFWEKSQSRIMCSCKHFVVFVISRYDT